MSGWTVLPVLHYLGWGFCTLWVLGTCWKERMWGNAVNGFNWWQAFLLSSLGASIAKTVVTSAVGGQSNDDQFTVAAVVMAIQWILFIAAFAGVKTSSDKLSRVKVAFHPIFDGVANLVVCLLLAGGIVVSTMPLLGLLLQGALAANTKYSLPTELGWLQGAGDGLPWQVATMFCGHWVLVAVAIVVLSKPSGRLEQPKKVEADA
ncbi:MAG TPA: hypothetical protein VND64_34555 [Pirellulales bacterium]|nr:hypothetical protein [Pirellulales bacterium]